MNLFKSKKINILGVYQEPVTKQSKIMFIVKFPNNIKYKEEYSTNLENINKFRWRVNNNHGLKAYQWFKKLAVQESSEKLS